MHLEIHEITNPTGKDLLVAVRQGSLVKVKALLRLGVYIDYFDEVTWFVHRLFSDCVLAWLVCLITVSIALAC